MQFKRSLENFEEPIVKKPKPSDEENIIESLLTKIEELNQKITELTEENRNLRIFITGKEVETINETISISSVDVTFDQKLKLILPSASKKELKYLADKREFQIDSDVAQALINTSFANLLWTNRQYLHNRFNLDITYLEYAPISQQERTTNIIYQLSNNTESITIEMLINLFWSLEQKKI